MSTLLRSIKRLLCFVFFVVCSLALFNYSSHSFFSMPSDYALWKRSGLLVTVSNVCTRNYTNANILNIDTDVQLNITDLQNEFHETGLKDGGAYSPRGCHSRQKIAILVPYRNRSEHLVKFLAHMHPFLQKQNTSYRIFVIEQSDSNPFSRGLLLNIGAVFATGGDLRGLPANAEKFDYDCLVFHDVDVLPENELNIYFCDERSIRHVASAIDEMRYHAMYYNQASTVVSVTPDNLKLINGFSNLYWGWGQEDDDFTSRALDVGLKISRPPYHIGRFKMLRHVKGWSESLGFSLFFAWKARYKQEGLNSLDRDIRYKVLSVENNPLYTNISVDLGEPPIELMEQAGKLPQMSLFSFLWFYFP